MRALAECCAGILDTKVAVTNEPCRWALQGGRTAEGGHGERGTHVLPAMMGQATPRTGIKREGLVKPALLGFDVGEVALPDHPRPIRPGHFGNPVFHDPVIVAAVRRARPEAALLPDA